MPAKDKINLLPKDSFENSDLGKLLSWATNVGRWIVVLTEFVVVCAFLSRFYFDTKLANLFDEVKQKQAIVDSAIPFEEKFLLTQEKIKMVKSLLAQEKKPSTFFTNISGFIPFNIFLTSLGLSENKLILDGYSLSDWEINLFVRELATEPHLSEISLDKINTDKNNPAVTNFSITAVVK
ncbi:MAG: PilN domain-containing protein [Microgenomates group bacterium]